MERLLASQSIMTMSQSRDQLHHYQRHPSSHDCAHGQVNTNTHWATFQPQQWLHPPPQPQMHLTHQLNQAELLQGSLAYPSSNIPPHQQQVALNNNSSISENPSSQRPGMEAPSVQLKPLQQFQQQGLARQAFASSIGAPPTNPLLAATMQQNAQPYASIGGDSSVASHRAANPHLATLLHQQQPRLQQALYLEALGTAQANPSSAGGSLATSGNVTSFADQASLLQKKHANTQQEQQPSSHMIPNLLHPQNHSLNGALESPREVAGSAPSPSAKGNSEGDT